MLNAAGSLEQKSLEVLNPSESVNRRLIPEDLRTIADRRPERERKFKKSSRKQRFYFVSGSTVVTL
jgi:hypothetical protein